ncbi:MAG: prepilin-type N-terminal cleavage/methylation domain-containing protein [Sulfuricurvum sp.]|nr:prepilin-type N-terminal cleavage/methylation domain-containing protein [Sulfuricurvum sp.]
MMRRGYTLIEIIITIAITGILSIGMFKAFEAITLRSEKAKILSTLSIDSQSALDQISALLYNRAPMFLKACTNSSDCVLFDETTIDKTIIQWYGLASESYAAGDYSEFVDMNQSIQPNLYSPNTELSNVLATEKTKWNDPMFDLSKMVLIFSGSFDEGDQNEYNITDSPTNTISIANTPPDIIYEKYNLVDSAYAVTRKQNAACSSVTDFKDDTLLLFYNYRPWKGQNFCDGNVTVLATSVNAFRAQMINGTIRLSIDMNGSVKVGSPVRLSKQKVVF